MITTALIIAGFILAIIAEIQAKGVSILAYAVILIAISLLIPLI
jgi:hypothetical protein